MRAAIRPRRSNLASSEPATRGILAPPGTGVVRFVPLGGLGEIGKNLALVESGDDVVMIDAGLRFPEVEMEGVDVVLPDISFVMTRRDRLRAVLLTHGHEDHIGALPFFLAMLNVPVYGTDVTIGLLRNKLERRGHTGAAELHVVRPGELIPVGAMTAEFIHMTHSVPGSCGIAISTAAGVVVHTGDFKIDQTPIGSDPPNLRRLGELGHQGVLLLLSDSTNAPNQGVTPSEITVRPALDRALRESPGRVIIVTFASNLARLRQIMELAEANGRRTCLVGRSMIRNVATAAELGFLRLPAGGLLAPRELAGIPDDKICLIATGSQGEPLAALSRIAEGTHRFVTAASTDTVVLAANPIPGNEATVNRVVNRLVASGVRLLAGSGDGVHASGHAAGEELRFVIELLRPAFFAPVHGEPRHLIAHRRIAMESGLREDRIGMMDNGTVLEVGPSRLRLAGRVGTGRVYIGGDGISRKVGRGHGGVSGDLLIASVTVDAQLRPLVESGTLTAVGAASARMSSRALDAGREGLTRALHNRRRDGFVDLQEAEELIRHQVERAMGQHGEEAPTVLPIVNLD